MSDEPQKDDDLQKKLDEAKQADQEQQKEESQNNQMEELKEQLVRCMADMQNLKRRAEEDKGKWIKFANYEFLKELLPVVDHFDRATQQVPENLKEDGWVKGVTQSHDELMKVLEKVGVKKIKTVGEKLDPNIHEAVMQDKGEKDVILEEFEPGYTYHEQTLKAAKVKVGNGEG